MGPCEYGFLYDAVYEHGSLAVQLGTYGDDLQERDQYRNNLWRLVFLRICPRIVGDCGVRNNVVWCDRCRWERYRSNVGWYFLDGIELLVDVRICFVDEVCDEEREAVDVRHGLLQQCAVYFLSFTNCVFHGSSDYLCHYAGNPHL